MKSKVNLFILLSDLKIFGTHMTKLRSW